MHSLDPSTSKRARTIVLLAAAFFLCGQLAAGLLLDLAPLNVRFSEAANLLAQARALDPSPDVVFFGSSRFMAAIAPEEVERQLRSSHAEGLPRTQVMAVLGGDLLATEFLFDQLLAEGVRPRIAVIEVSPEWLARPSYLLGAQLQRLFRWPDVIRWLPELWESDWQTLLRARVIPVYHYRRELLAWLVGSPSPYLGAPALDPGRAVPAGAGKSASFSTPPLPSARSSPSETSDDPAHGVERWAQWLRSFRLCERCAHRLERILAHCREERVACVLVEPPLASGHRALYRLDVATPYRELLARLDHEYGAPFFGYQDRLSDDFFRDSSHVNSEGARRFSELLARSVIEPLWFRSEPGTAAAMDSRSR